MAEQSREPGSEERFFLAVNIPAALRSVLMATQTALQHAQARVSWVPEDNLHLTVAFLGPLNREGVETLIKGIIPISSAHTHFQSGLRRLGTFGRPSRPRVIWAGCDASPELTALHADVLARLTACGFKMDARPYRPHITLGRVRAADRIAELNAAIDAQRDTHFGDFPVEELVLYKSTLEASHAVHTPIHRITLV